MFLYICPCVACASVKYILKHTSSTPSTSSYQLEFNAMFCGCLMCNGSKETSLLSNTHLAPPLLKVMREHGFHCFLCSHFPHPLGPFDGPLKLWCSSLAHALLVACFYSLGYGNIWVNALLPFFDVFLFLALFLLFHPIFPIFELLIISFF